MGSVCGQFGRGHDLDAEQEVHAGCWATTTARSTGSTKEAEIPESRSTKRWMAWRVAR